MSQPGIRRYNRQELITGWKQEKISKARVAVIGSGHLAQFTLASLVALGFGTVEVYADETIHSSPEFLTRLSKAPENTSTAENLEHILALLNPLVSVHGIHLRLDQTPLYSLLEKPDILIDTTNDPTLQNLSEQYATTTGIPYIASANNGISGKIVVKQRGTKIDLSEYTRSPQGAVLSEIFGGIICEEARKIAMPLKEETRISSFTYTFAHPLRASTETTFNLKQDSLKHARILLIGAGALGTAVGIGLAYTGLKHLDILDYDTIEDTNLHRQILFYDGVGKEKAKALATKLKIIAPQLVVKGIVGKLDEHTDYFTTHTPDLIVDCVDNLASRAYANYFALKHQIPLVSGGTSPAAGQIAVYKPNYSSCLDCKLSVDKSLAKERSRHSCVHAPTPSVIMTNQIIGGMMVGEIRSTLLPDSYGPPIAKVLRYDARHPSRVGFFGSDKPCSCTRGNLTSWLKELS